LYIAYQYKKMHHFDLSCFYCYSVDAKLTMQLPLTTTPRIVSPSPSRPKSKFNKYLIIHHVQKHL